jgi:hypothetical protein
MHIQRFFPASRLILAAFLIASPLISTSISTAPNSAALPLAPTLDLVTIPPLGVGITLTIDGICSQAEYSTSAAYSFVDIGNTVGTVYLVHDESYLYVCMVATKGTFASRFGSLYLDPQGNGTTYTYAQQDDFALRVVIPGNVRSSYRGSGVPNGYVNDPGVDTWWNGAATADKTDMVEYKVNLKAFGLNICSSLFRMAVYHHWVQLVDDDYGWPSAKFFDQPGTWQLVNLGSPSCGAQGKIAYVFRGNTIDATSFYAMLTGAGYGVTLVPLASVLSTDFSLFDLIVIADDTGSLDQWGTPGLTAAQVDKIANPNPGRAGVPILGLGEGGYAFFGRLSLFIGWPQGWHGPQNQIYQLFPTYPPFSGLFGGVSGVNPATHYTVPTNSVGIYTLPPPLPPDVTAFGGEYPLDDHASLILQGCRMLWGNSGNPLGMTADGVKIFLNTVAYMKVFQCPAPPPPPPADCFSITKAASPVGGTPLAPGSTILYTITYQMKITSACPVTAGKLVDKVPLGTIYVPNSASDGITPAADGTLAWPVESSGLPLTKSFKVLVSDAACMANQLVTNFATLYTSGVSPLDSNTVSHPVTCPPVGLPSNEPMYVEDELQIDPYPLVTGHATILSVRVKNLTVDFQPVTVKFQTSQDRFGIGLDYATIGVTSLTLPPNAEGEFSSTYIPVASGNQCIQAQVSYSGMIAPLVTQRCVDVTEDLTPGVTDKLTIPVRNNTAAMGDVILVVENTCPGWTASVDPSVLTGMAPGEIRSVTFNVTPPAGGVLGTACHIDLQAWINGKLIGGIRKLDVPPVHLPENVQPPWEESEISFNPDPPVAGVQGQICVKLVNPLPVIRTVTLDFAVADFGAGIGFTPVAEEKFNLPPNSIDNYCVKWTPSGSGTLHQCVLVTLKQEGFQDQRSQRNMDIVRADPGDVNGMIIPFVAGNPDLVDHLLSFQIHLVGINPPFGAMIQMMNGEPVPETIPAGRRFMLRLILMPLMAPGISPLPAVASNFDTFGSQPRVEVEQFLDGVSTSGFSVQFQVRRLYLPEINK